MQQMLDIRETSSAGRSVCCIEHADCNDFLASLDSGSVDLLLTDPPYAISRQTGFGSVKTGEKRFAVSMDFGEWDHTEIDLHKFACNAFSALRKGGTAIVWYDIWKFGELRYAFEDAGFRMFRQIVWQKTNPVPLNSRRAYLTNSREMALCCVKGKNPTFHSSYDTGIYKAPIPRHNGQRIHPTQKPVDLFIKLILKHSNPGDLVVDPFLGSGTTAEAVLKGGGGENVCGMRSRPVLRKSRATSHRLIPWHALNHLWEIYFWSWQSQTQKVSAEKF